MAANSRPPTRRSASRGSPSAVPWVACLAFRRAQVARPIFRRSAEQREQQGGGHRAVARADVAKRHQIDATGNRLHAEGHGCRAAEFIERRFARDVPGRVVERQIEDFQAHILGRADLRDHRPACRQQVHPFSGLAHVPRTVTGSRDAVIAGKDRCQRFHHRLARIAPPAREPLCNCGHAPHLFARGQLFAPVRCSGKRALVGIGQVGKERAEIIKGRAGGHGRS